MQTYEEAEGTVLEIARRLKRSAGPLQYTSVGIQKAAGDAFQVVLTVIDPALKTEASKIARAAHVAECDFAIAVQDELAVAR